MKNMEFPLIALVVSGGHTELIYMKEDYSFERIGGTLDDAVGEAYDKVARLIGLPYPGGVNLDKLAQTGNPFAFKLPEAKLQNEYDFSFSGLKTASLQLIQKLKKEYEECFGPLTHKSGSGYVWIKDPWPWEYMECDC